MTEQELLSEIQANAGTYEDFTARTTAIFAAAKAYAAAQVAAKDAEIARLQIEVENLKSYQQSLECDNFHANAHADTFEAEIAALKADNARMREGVATQVDRLHKLHNNSSTLSDDDCEWLRSIAKELNALLSPADDTYDSGKWGVPNNLDRPADGYGVEETSAGGNMENPSFLIGAKCDDGEPVSLHIHHGNNGDFYPEIRYKDKKDGNWRRSPSPRISTSGGHNGPEILIAIANLYRALAGRGIEG